MTKQEYRYYSGVFYDAFFKVADWKKEHSEDNQYYSVPIHNPEVSRIRCVPDGNNRFWITSRNCDNPWYQLDDVCSNKAIRRVYASTKGCIQSLLKSFLDVIEDELDGEGI
jgi:hypothetical protein